VQQYARLLKSNFPTIDSALHQKHLFQMTVSEHHSVNLAGLNKAMTELGLRAAAGAGAGVAAGAAAGAAAAAGPAAPLECFLYFVVPPDVYPKYKHLPGSMVPVGSALPANVKLIVLELPAVGPSRGAAAAGAVAAPAGRHKRSAATQADQLVPPVKKAKAGTCRCVKECKGNCGCVKYNRKCTGWHPKY